MLTETNWVLELSNCIAEREREREKLPAGTSEISDASELFAVIRMDEARFRELRCKFVNLRRGIRGLFDM